MSLLKEQAREAWSFRSLESWAQDVTLAVRMMRRSPRVTGLATLILALSIGSTTAIFSVVDTVVLRPLPYPESERLVVAWQEDRTDRSWFNVAPANFLDWQQHGEVFESLAAVQQFQDVEFNLAEGTAPEAVRGVHVSPELFRVLRVAPTLGRAFTAEDLESDVVVLSYDIWAGRFGADPRIIGRDLRLNGTARRVIGVMPRGFAVPLIQA